MAILFHLAAVLVLAAALLAIRARRASGAALSLAAFSLLLAVALLAIGAPFLAFTQLFLQIGPIVAIARHRGDLGGDPGKGSSEEPSGGTASRARPPHRGIVVPAAVAALAFALLAAAALSSSAVGEPAGPDLLASPGSRAAREAGGARSIGESLYTSGFGALVAAGVLVLATTVAATTLSGRGRAAPERKP